MKNKGFTLIELLVTIALLAAISITVGVNMAGMLNRQDANDFENYQHQIEDAACLYAELDNTIDKLEEGKNSTSISINVLFENGYLKNNIVIPTAVTIGSETKKNVSIKDYIDAGNTIKVTVKWDDEGQKSCECENDCI